MDTSKCVCTIRPFEPPIGCFEYCTAKIIRYAQSYELEMYLGLSPELSDKIFEITADDSLRKLSDFEPELTEKEFDLLRNSFQNINSEGWDWIETTMKDRMSNNIPAPI